MTSATLLSASRQRRVSEDSLGETAYRLLKEKIVTLALPPAALLNEAGLMAELGLGRTPLREALQRLALENLVVILPRRGTMVADVNMSDLQKVFEVRLELEPFAAGLAAGRATPAQVRAMEALFEPAGAVLAGADPRRLIDLDRQAHHLLAQASHNELLAETLERLYVQVLRLWYTSLDRADRLAEAIAEHRAIIAAVKAGDGPAAAALMRAHVAGFQQEFKAAGAGR